MNKESPRTRAGIIPFYIHSNTVKMLFMIPANPKFGGSSPQCCKGKVEEGENLLQTAMREGYEELGLFEGNVKEIYPLKTKVGTTHFFIAHIKDPDLFGIPHFETGETVWLTYDQYMERGRYLHRPAVTEAYKKIQEINYEN